MLQKNIWKLLSIMCLGTVALSPMIGLANVSLKNGDFFMGYTDIIYSGGFEPKIERVYNSKSSFKGIFGWGWGNEYEAYLNVSADGSVVVHEFGGGAENRFSPSSFSVTELDKAVDALGAVAQKAGVAGNSAQLASYKQKLKTDAQFRNDEWEKFRAQNKIGARQLAVGTQLRSNKFSYQYITKVADGYIRVMDSGKVEKFDENGKLTKISDKNNNFISFTYTKDGHVQKLVDNFNRKIFFEFNNKGLVSKLEGENGKKAEYRYNDKDELVFSKDVDGNTYGYKYDSANRHNMIAIEYSDKTTLAIAYYPVGDKHENVKTTTDRDGTITEYDYDIKDRLHITVSLLIKGTDGKVISNSKYEYVTKVKADGEEWTYQLNTVLDGDRTDTTYNEACGLPVLISHNGEKSTFEYDGKCHVTKKVTPDETTELRYDAKAGKVDRVTKYVAGSKSPSSWSEFKYDEKANLVFANNSEKKSVKLFYDSNGRIRTLLDQGQHQINFKYNENSKPVEISDPKLGTITVTYTNSGEIKKVDSTAGRKIALQVTSSFQNLLEIIRPAGVTLSF